MLRLAVLVGLIFLVRKLFKKLATLHREINGKWIEYLWALKKLKKTTKRRFAKHDVISYEPKKNGFLPTPEDWRLEQPSLRRNEDVFIFGVNNARQHLTLSFNWRPQLDGSVTARVSLNLDLGNGDWYYLDEEDKVRVEPGSNEYRVAGVSFEMISPMRRYRIKIRSYLKKKGTDQLVFVKSRLLWLPLSNVFDHRNDHSKKFIAKELVNFNSANFLQFENRWDQIGQIKGTVQVEDSKSEEIYLWGSRSKILVDDNDLKITRILGYTKEGESIQLGFARLGDQMLYRFGHAKWTQGCVAPLNYISLDEEALRVIVKEQSRCSFEAKFDDKTFKVDIEQKILGQPFRRMFVDGNEGWCLVVEEQGIPKKNEMDQLLHELQMSRLVISLDDSVAEYSHLTGGKGSSLAQLKKLSNQLSTDKNSNQFLVPDGVVVTTNAYKLWLNENTELTTAIEDLQKSVWSLTRDNTKQKCEQFVKLMSGQELLKDIKQDIDYKLTKVFGHKYDQMLFAVRSSASGEDSAEMSAAGQMTTFLGVKGLEEINRAVVKCWASQFEFVPVEYKRGYGQLINSPMAVVIQEMIDCDSAGVIFTCDPATGDERLITVTANYGLGETIVSASAEPDTIQLSVDLEGNSLIKSRRISKIKSKVIGSKKKVLKLASGGGTTYQEGLEHDKCCVSDEDLFRLGDLAIKTHVFYGNPRDIEWGIKNSQIIMLQSRPITNLDNSYTEYEIAHEIDSGHSSEREVLTRAHWGENLPGSTSYTWFSWYMLSLDKKIFHMLIDNGQALAKEYCPYIHYFGAVAYNQLFCTLKRAKWNMLRNLDTKFGQEFFKSFFGHQVNDPDFFELAKENQKYERNSVLGIFFFIKYMLWNALFAYKTSKAIFEDSKKNLDMVRQIKYLNARKAFEYLTEHLEEINFRNRMHGPISITSSMATMILRKILAGAKEDNPLLEEDMLVLMSSCNDVVSAEVPAQLKKIALAIPDKENFKILDDEKALELLRNDSGEASVLFEEFLKRHGHRGYREIDPMTKTWAKDPKPLVKNIKMMLAGGDEALKIKEVKSVDDVLSSLKTPLKGGQRWLIAKFVLPWARNAVGHREHSKYYMTWTWNKVREGLVCLAEKMVQEGLIPDVETFFFLTVEEVEQLVNGNRDPTLLGKTRFRKRVYQKTNKLKFEELVKGPEIRPRNLEEDSVKIDSSKGAVKMTGTAVFLGKTKARVCVAEDIEQADQIQAGDILVTYSTDIGWSPYFPLLSGLVTEIGGTISHGSVIAREYGIPCLIAVDGACRVFNTGDVCVLDADSGEIVRVEE